VRGVVAAPGQGPRTLALFGDSFTGNVGPLGTVKNPVPDNSTVRSDGYWTWASIRLGGRIQAVANKGVGGNTTTQMLARLGADILAMNPLPGWVLYQGGTNDPPNGITTPTTIANDKACFDQLRAAGIGVVITAMPPHGTNKTQGAINRARRDYALANPGCLWVDWFTYTANPVDATWPVATLGTSDDGIHPNIAGASVMGKALYDVLSVAFPPLDIMDAGSNADAESLITNSGMTGTTGALGTSTGVLATGWTGRYGANAVLSKVARTDGPLSEWQQVAMTSPGAVAGDMYQSWAAPIGSVLQASAEFQTDPATFPSTYVTVASTINGTASAVTVNSTTGFPASGVFYVSGVVVTYTGTTATTFTGCTSSVVNLTVGAGVTTLYDLALSLAYGSGGAAVVGPRNAGGAIMGNGVALLPAQGIIVLPPVAVTAASGFLFCKFSASVGTMRWGRASLKRLA